MSGSAINLVTVALKSRLKNALDNCPINGDVFVGPLDDEGVHDAKLILFLYRVAPNATLRNSEHRIVTATPPPQIFRNSLPLDLYYLVTVGTTIGSEEEPLVCLGFAMKELQSDPILTVPELGYQSVKVTLEPLTTDESSRIWNLFPTANYRTSVAYLATPVWIDPEHPTVDARPVVDDRLKAGTRAVEGVL